MNDELRALSDKAHERIDTLTSQYKQALRQGNNGLASVIQGQRADAIAYAQGVEDCRGIMR